MQQLSHEEEKTSPMSKHPQTHGCTCTQAHISQTVLSCGGSEESAGNGVCAAPVSIMLSFSVTLLGASLRLLLPQQDLHLRLTEMKTRFKKGKAPFS